ncbi:MAG: hypothetical protein ABIA02_03795 [Candidatus Falkowbacteria bacterium]
MYYKIAQLMLTPGKKANTISDVFVAQPDANKESLAGKLFALAEIELNKSENLKIVNFLIDNINHNYYQNEKIILRERISDLKVEHIFESALAKTNKNLVEFLHNEKIKLDPKLINITIGVIYKNDLHFASIGKNKATLICKNKDLSDSGYKAINVENDENKKLNPAKLFTNVISGHIHNNCYFIFNNETLSEFLSEKQLIDIITKLPPGGAIEQIKNTLSKINSYVSFLAIIIKNSSMEEPSIKPSIEVVNTSARTSIEGLRETEETTEKFLTPTGIISPKKLTSYFSKILPNFSLNKKEKISDSKNILIKDRIIGKKKSNLFSFQKIIKIIKNIFVYSFNFIIYFFKIITNKNNLVDFLKSAKIKAGNLKRAFSDSISKLFYWFKNLNKINKILFSIGIICLILFIGNSTILFFKNKKVKIEETYNSSIEEIEQKQNQVEASLLYSNEAGAKKILEEIDSLLSIFPRETESQISDFNELTKKHKEQLEKIRHVVKISKSNELANFVNLNSNANPENLMLIKDDENKIYTGDSEQKSIYVLNLPDNSVTAITDLSININNLNYPTSDKNNNIYYFNLNNIIKLNTKKEEMSSLEINIKNNPNNISGIANFNNKLYLIDNKENEILRYNIAENGFSPPYSWLANNYDLSSATGIAIDGHIYILKENGDLEKYLKGEKENFSLDKIEPKIEKASKIFVSSEQKYIYILESIKNRLAVFDKTGKFILQYQSDEFNNLKDFAVLEDDEKIYFLNNTSIYEITAEHFE